MQVITTHINADFDGLASMVAAQKIYPDAVMVFSGSQEKNLRDFINENLQDRYEFTKIKQIELKTITRLIVVDTRNSPNESALCHLPRQSRHLSPPL